MINSNSLKKIVKHICLAIIVTSASNAYSQNVYSFSRDSKEGLVDNKMNIVIKPKYIQINNTTFVGERFDDKDYLIFKLNNKYGIMNFKEEVILPPKYDELYFTNNENIFSFTINNLGGLINLKGEKIFSENHSSFNITNNGNTVIKNSKKQGYRQYSILNMDGSLVKKFGKDTILSSNYYDSSSDILLYKTDYKYGYIDSKGTIITNARFSDASHFKNDYAIVKYLENESDFFSISRIINKKGKFAKEEKYQSIDFKRSITFYGGQETDENFYYFKINDKVGLLDENLNVIVEPKYSQIGKFNEGLAFVANEEGKYGFIDTKGKEIISLIYDDADFFSEGLAPVVKNGKWGFIDKKNNVVIDFQYTGNMKPFSDGLALYRKNNRTSKTDSNEDKCGFINKKGEFIIEPVFYDAKSFKNDVAIVANKGVYFIIDKKGNRFKLYQDESYENEEILEEAEIKN